MNYKKLMRTYIWLLFCNVVVMLLCAYVYIIHFYNYMLFGFILCLNSIPALIQLIIASYKDNKGKSSRETVT